MDVFLIDALPTSLDDQKISFLKRINLFRFSLKKNATHIKFGALSENLDYVQSLRMRIITR